MPGEPVAPLAGRRTMLRPIHPDDYNYLYWLATNEETAWRWRFRQRQPSFNEFVEALHAGVQAQYLACKRSDGRPFGLVVSYNADFYNGTTYLAVQLDPEHLHKGWTLEAVGVFLNHLFTMHDFFKVYIEAPEFNYADFASWNKLFSQEGRLVGHEKLGGRRWDRLILSLTNDQWQANRGWIARMCGLPEP